MKEAGATLDGVSPRQLVVDVQEPREEVPTVKPQHGIELVVAAPTRLVSCRERLLDLRLIEAVERRIALPVRELEAIGD